MRVQYPGHNMAVEEIDFAKPFLIDHYSINLICIKAFIEDDGRKRPRVVALAPGHHKLSRPGGYQIEAFYNRTGFVLESAYIQTNVSLLTTHTAERISEESGIISFAEAPLMTIAWLDDSRPWTVNLETGALDIVRHRTNTSVGNWAICLPSEDGNKPKTIFEFPKDVPNAE